MMSTKGWMDMDKSWVGCVSTQRDVYKFLLIFFCVSHCHGQDFFKNLEPFKASLADMLHGTGN